MGTFITSSALALNVSCQQKYPHYGTTIDLNISLNYFTCTKNISYGGSGMEDVILKGGGLQDD